MILYERTEFYRYILGNFPVTGLWHVRVNDFGKFVKMKWKMQIWIWNYRNFTSLRVYWRKMDYLHLKQNTVNDEQHTYTHGCKQIKQSLCFWATTPFKWVNNYCESQLSNESHFACNFVHFQINFTQNHKKVLISPIEQKITFIRNKMTSNNFRTLTFTALAKHGFSLHSFAMFKYVTAVVQLLALRLTEN